MGKGGLQWGDCSGGHVVGGYLSLSEICMHMIGTVENNGGGGGEEIAYINYLYYLTNVFFDLGFDPVPESQVCSVLQAFLYVVSWFVYLVERADVLALVACG